MTDNQNQIYILLLEEYIKDLECELLSNQVNKELDEWLKVYHIPQPNPYIPPPDPWNKSTCPKCGMKLDGTMGYCCPNMDCPTGMGPIICKS
jgi:hypothetical protein